MTKSSELITLVDQNRVVEVSNKDKLREYLNNSPPSTWIKEHPFAKGVSYVPIDKTEVLLDSIFQDWEVEIKSVAQLAQSICAIVRLHYRDPVTNEWKFHDGVGAVPLKTDKGASAADLSKIKSDAVATGAPAAVSFAIKDAADHIGKIFGRDLNRKDTVSLAGFYKNTNEKQEPNEDEQNAIKGLEGASTIDELRSIYGSLPVKMRTSKVVVSRKDELKKSLSKTKEDNENIQDRTK